MIRAASISEVGLARSGSFEAIADAPRSCAHDRPLNPEHRMVLRHLMSGMIKVTASLSLRGPKALTTELRSDLVARWDKLSQCHKAEGAVHKRKHFEQSKIDHPIYTRKCAEGSAETGAEVSDIPRLRLKCTPKEARVYLQNQICRVNCPCGLDDIPSMVDMSTTSQCRAAEYYQATNFLSLYIPVACSPPPMILQKESRPCIRSPPARAASCHNL